MYRNWAIQDQSPAGCVSPVSMVCADPRANYIRRPGLANRLTMELIILELGADRPKSLSTSPSQSERAVQ